MVRVFQVAALALVLTAIALCGFACWGIGALVSAGRQVAADSQATLRAATAAEGLVGAAAVNLNTEITRPCRGPKGPDACGLLAQVKKVAIDSGDAVVTAQLQVKQTSQLIASTTVDLDSAAADIHQTAIAVSGTAQAGTSFLNVLANPDSGLPAAVNAYTESGNDLDALLKKKAVSDFVDNLAPLSANLAAGTATADKMLATADQVETKATSDYLHPSKNPLKRTWQAIEPFSVAAAKIAATAF